MFRHLLLQEDYFTQRKSREALRFIGWRCLWQSLTYMRWMTHLMLVVPEGVALLPGLSSLRTRMNAPNCLLFIIKMYEPLCRRVAQFIWTYLLISHNFSVDLRNVSRCRSRISLTPYYNDLWPPLLRDGRAHNLHPLPWIHQWFQLHQNTF